VPVAVGLDWLSGERFSNYALQVRRARLALSLGEYRENSDAVALLMRRANHSGVPCSMSVWTFT
jgi:hypothetical protein